MAFDKLEYTNRKDHRKQYYDERADDPTCRSHGSCGHRKKKQEYKDAKRGKYGREEY